MTANEIKNIIIKNLSENGERIAENFNIGEYIDLPNQRGAFEIKDRWFTYETDEKNVKSISGPFDDTDIIYACAKMMHKSKYFEEYRFSEEAKKIYIHSHFRSIKEAENC